MAKPRTLTIDGETHTIAEWSEISKVNKSTISTRLAKGMEPKEAVFGKVVTASVSGRRARKKSPFNATGL